MKYYDKNGIIYDKSYKASLKNITAQLRTLKNKIFKTKPAFTDNVEDLLEEEENDEM